MSKFVSICLLLIAINTYSQHSEVGVFGGIAYYNGELNPSIQLINEVNPVIGLFYRKNLSTRYALKYGANYGKISATDRLNSSDLSSFRDLSFSASILDAYGILEFNFLPYQINNDRTTAYSPYVFIGLAAFRVNPTIENSNEITTTGTKYGPAIPFGAGIKFNFIENLGMSIEWTFRKTFSDEIDGLPPTYLSGYQLSNTQNNDWYSFFGITLNYKFLTESDVCPDVFN